jgi:DNA-binding NtrC family response regulator
MKNLPEGRILVVDDQPNLCWVLSKLLSERGHAMRIAYNGQEALGVLASFDCQVAVVDYRLPDMDGITLIAKMRQRLPNLRAILMSSYGSASLRLRATDEDLFAYLDKPFNNELMICTIEDGVGLCRTGTDSRPKGERARTRFPGRLLPD